MAYTNSSLVTYKNLSPNNSGTRSHSIDTITIHCIVGQWTAKQGCDFFSNSSAGCSANYVVGKDGSVGLSVEEKNRAWTSSSSTNDNRAVTIEVASDTSEPYAVTDAAYNALIKLVADICKRNGIKKLVWSTNKSDRVNHNNGCNMTVHRDFANKSCPGTYLYERHGKIATAVNNLLGTSTSSTSSTTTSTTTESEVKTVNVKMQVIYSGNTSNRKGQVQTAQRILNELKDGSGYRGKDGKKLTVDGVFGTNTDYAVKAYQKAHGLTVDGVIGQNTWNKLLCYVP